MITTVSTAYTVYNALPAETQEAIKAKFTSTAYTSLPPEQQRIVEEGFRSMLEAAKDAGTSASSEILNGVSALFGEEASKSMAEAQSTVGWILSYVPSLPKLGKNGNSNTSAAIH
jgi:hypothetical protein